MWLPASTSSCPKYSRISGWRAIIFFNLSSPPQCPSLCIMHTNMLKHSLTKFPKMEFFSLWSDNFVKYQVYKYEMTIFFPKKKHVKFGRMIKRNLFKVCSIASYTFFPSFEQFVDTTPVKIFPFCREHSSSHFFTSSYESKHCSASAWPIDANKW